MKLSTQLAFAAAVIAGLVSIASTTVWAQELGEVVANDANDEAVSLAVTLADANYPDITRRNDAQVQLELESVSARVPDIAFVMATDARQGDRVIAAVPKDLVGAIVPDVVPLAVTRSSRGEAGVRATKTFLLRDGSGGGVAGDPIIDASEVVRSRDGMVVGAIRVGIRYERRDELVRRSLRHALGIGAAVLALGILLAVFISRRVVAPVADLRRRMRAVAEGKLEEHASSVGPTEVRELAVAYNGMIAGLKEKRALERYVPQDARRQIDGRASEAGIVAPRRERVVILFADLRGFSTLSEKSAPSDVLAMLSEYSDAMSDTVSSFDGDVNELLGDAVLAVFPGEHAATNAVRCAAAMQLRLRDIASGELRMGIGLHAGDVVLGTIGSGERLKFAVVGDAVNVAARIQEKSKTSANTAVLASADVRALAGEDLPWIDLGEMEVRGRSGNVHVWELDRLA